MTVYNYLSFYPVIF